MGIRQRCFRAAIFRIYGWVAELGLMTGKGMTMARLVGFRGLVMMG
jgi:hypothetical protein